MANQKTSILINRQLPEFIREEYPLFQTFLEAYFEFLENRQGTQKNDLINRAKELRNISDVDLSLVDFEEQFLNTYAQFFPKDTAVTKEFLIKNVMPFYLAKGSEKSFKFLFRSLFNQEIEFKRVSDNIIRTSDGEWIKENKLRIDKEFRLYHVANGTKKVFDLLFPAAANAIRVYINGIIQSSSSYFVRPEALKLTFYTAPTNNSVVEIYYDDYTLFDPTKLFSRTVKGLVSGATIISEKIVEEKINDIEIFSFFSVEKNIIGEFLEGETVEFTAFNAKNIKITIRAQTVSILSSINIIDGGSNYNVGDPVRIVGGQSGSFIIPAAAIVSDVFRGFITKVKVLYGGAGFFLGNLIEPTNVSNIALSLAIEQVSTTGELSSTLTSNTFYIYTNLISDIDIANTTISANNYGFPANIISAGENVNTVISHALSNTSFVNIGPIQTVAILYSNASFAVAPQVDATPAFLSVANGSISIRDFGTLGRFKINNGGLNYAVGDEAVFTNPTMGIGVGAAATVESVGSGGVITAMKFQPHRISGKVGVTAGSAIVGGDANTRFEVDLKVGDRIRVANQDRTVTTITSNVTLAVASNFTANASNVIVGKLDVYPVGGQNYTNKTLPTMTINSANGTGANIVVTTIYGDGENLDLSGTRKPGEILSITILNPGRGFVQVPTIDLTEHGDKNAVANATIENPVNIISGRFISSKGIISAEEMRIQSGNYYHNYSYTISADLEFKRYKSIIDNLIHPVGFQSHGEWAKLQTINTITPDISTVSNVITTTALSGKVNVANSSIYVIGTGTKFVAAYNNGLISNGSFIAVNSQIRIVNSIISNTNLSVSSAFTITANNQEMVVFNVSYSSIATEVELYSITTESDRILTIQP